MTSGSTGIPKGVVHGHGDVRTCLATYGARVLRLRPGDVTWSVAGLATSYGFGNSCYFPLGAGACAWLGGADRSPQALRKSRGRPIGTTLLRLCSAKDQRQSVYVIRWTVRKKPTGLGVDEGRRAEWVLVLTFGNTVTYSSRRLFACNERFKTKRRDSLDAARTSARATIRHRIFESEYLVRAGFAQVEG